jgi:uncharacterized protein
MRLTVAMEKALRRLCLLGCFSFVSQLPAQRANGQAQPAGTAASSSSCVSPEMARLIVQERDGIRVNSPRQVGNEAAAVRDNARGIVATKAPETAETMTQAHKWFQKAARRGYAPGQVNLAVLSLAGWGTWPNAGEALYWLHAAARQGYAPALFDLGIVYLQGCGVRRDYAEAFRFFEKGALGGDPAAQMNLGYLYDQGLGVAQNRSEAAQWYRRAADSGELRAQYNLGDLYLRGEGVPHDESAAFAWFHKAALGGHAEARIMLGSMYAAGRGTLEDSTAAYMWLSLAALQGDFRVNAQLDALRSQMTTEQIMEATGRARSLAQVSKRRLQQSLFH